MRIRVLQGFIDFIRGKKHFYSFCFPIYHFIKHKMGKSIIAFGSSHVNFFGINRTSADFQEAIHINKFNVGINFCDRDLFKYPQSKISAFHLEPVLAYNLNKYNTTSLGREKIEYMINHHYINKGATILCCFGEIDVRVQLFKQSKKLNKPIEEVMNDILNSYLEFLLYLKEKGFKVCCWGVTPSGNVLLDGIENFPHIEVNKAKEIFNNKLENVCKNNNFVFVNIFDKLINEDYSFKDEYAFDGFHLNRKAWDFAEKALKEAGIL